MTGPFDPARAAEWPEAIGCDEVGLGALCGPVIVVAARFDAGRLDPALLGALDDSKRLAAPRRVALAAALRAAPGEVRWALAAASVGAQAREGLRGATLAAMVRAARRLGEGAPLLVDGTAVPPGLPGARALVRGERAAPQIAAASILAKVARDRLMARLAARWPGYGWETNMGYGAAAHLAALARLGATPHHRPHFAPVAAAIGTVGLRRRGGPARP